MKIEIRKTQFINKGAELMLHAILQQLTKEIENPTFVMVPRNKLNPYSEYAKLGIHPKAALYFKGKEWGSLSSLLPDKVKDLYGIIDEKDIDVVLDAGGFEYTDFWGDDVTVELAEGTKRWRKQGKKVILLPQAFGPFTSKKIKKAFKVVVKNSDLIFARDKESLEHIEKLVGKVDHVKLAPDFTNIVKGIIPDYFDSESHQFCVIPNYRMIDKTDAKLSKNYVDFVSNSINFLCEKQQKPFILIHEGDKDYKLALEIRGKNEDVPILKENNPLKIKGIIGASRGLISSRYHGLISGLSQGVPSIGTSWSHKYKELFNDYEFDGLVNLKGDYQSVFDLHDYFFDEELYQKNRQHLLEKSEFLKKQTKAMWDNVMEIINR
jgi:polysaccharide pyruvyl transferase WcaK-like protein